MRKLSRYLRVLCQHSNTNMTKALVGLLVVGMPGNTASAEHWFYGMDCMSPCQPLVVEVCPPAPCCLPVECCHELAADGFETPDPGPAPSAPPAKEAIAPPPAVAIPEEDIDQPESSIVNKPATETDNSEPDVAEAPSIIETPPEPEPASGFDPPATPEPMLEENPADDSFPVPADDSDDLFDEPASAEPASKEVVPAEVDLQDEPLLSTEEESELPADPAPVEPAPAEESDDTEDPSLDDLFGQPVLSEPGGLASRAVRQWTDDGARFRCEARLQQVTAKTVVLVKNSGKRIAVSFSRLSGDDLQFVRRQVVAQRELLAQRAAAELLASLGSK